jgi:3-oxoacyl-[acyl-carrier protein] reductase
VIRPYRQYCVHIWRIQTAHSPHYSATKGAVVAFTKSVAMEVAGGNVYVNAIAAGGVLTPQFKDYLARSSEKEKGEFFQLIPSGRLGTPEEYASLVLYLASNKHYLVGEIVRRRALSPGDPIPA